MNGWITPIGYHKHGEVSTLKTSIDVGVGCILCTGLLPLMHVQPVEVCYTALENRLQAVQ